MIIIVDAHHACWPAIGRASRHFAASQANMHAPVNLLKPSGTPAPSYGA
jgi:hypothetical protein